jgi:hypothetical protein
MSVPNPLIVISIISPTSIFPTPGGDPVMMTSPGINVMMDEMYSISSSTLKSMDEIGLCCRISPLSLVVMVANI